MNFIFLVLVRMPRFLKADFLQEGMIRIVNLFASFTCLCNSNQDPAQELWNRKTWIIKQANKYVYWYAQWTYLICVLKIVHIVILLTFVQLNKGDTNVRNIMPILCIFLFFCKVLQKYLVCFKGFSVLGIINRSEKVIKIKNLKPSPEPGDKLRMGFVVIVNFVI